MALDGFVVDVPDTPANERAFGRPGSSRAPAAFPQARVLSLCETGSHVLRVPIATEKKNNELGPEP